MTDIHALFKKPHLPSSSSANSSGPSKRKFETADADQIYKSTKLSHRSSPSSSSSSSTNNGHRTTVADEDNDDDTDTEAGPALPPDEDEDEDEEGRFFGGGVTADTAEALDYLDTQDEETYAEEKIDAAWLRRLNTSFERKIAKNAELRARFPDDPTKFMASEAELDAEVKTFSLLTGYPGLWRLFVGEGGMGSLVGLVGHENTDVAAGVLEVLGEMVDEDVEGGEAGEWEGLVEGMVGGGVVELILGNLGRLKEEDVEEAEGDASGVYHSLAVLEGLAGARGMAERVGGTEVLEWLCRRIARDEKPVGQNKQYAAEVLQVLLQSSGVVRRRLAVDVEGVDLFLRLLAAYRKRDPEKDSTEEEYAENLFDALTCVVDEAEGKAKFVEAEGVELCLLMLKEGTFSKLRALRLLDHAMAGQGAASAEVCEKLVDAAGLKVIFSLFMKKTDNATVEHLLGIFSALLRLLPGESAARIRTLAKFNEKDYGKLAKLVTLRKEYAKRVAAVDDEISLEKRMLDEEEAEERADEFFSRRMDGGLYCLQTVDVVLAWLAAEDEGARKKVEELLGGVGNVRDSLKEQIALLDPKAAEDEEMRDMLGTLVSFLE